MKTFSPIRTFLRVDDKHYPEYVHDADELGNTTASVYSYLFRRAKRSGSCDITQKVLCQKLKVKLRTLQNHLKKLAKLEYIRVERTQTGNVYHLLLSARLLDLTAACGVELIEPKAPAAAAAKLPPAAPAPSVQTTASVSVAGDAQAHNLHIPSAQFAHSSLYKKEERRDKRSPLSPRIPVNAPGVSPAPVRPICGGSFFSKSRVQADFERLWAVWPVKKGKLLASRSFMTLARSGILPALPDLLAAVERFKREDAHWLNGCPSKLSNWLRGHEWHDEPFVRVKQAPLPTRPDDAAIPRNIAAAEKRACSPEQALAWLKKITDGHAVADELAPHDTGTVLQRIQAFKAAYVNAASPCLA